MNTRRLPIFDREFPWLVSVTCFVDGHDYSTYSSHPDKRSAEEERHYLIARGRMNVDVIENRAVPRKGAFGGWRTA